MAISCYRGGRFTIPVEIEPPYGMSSMLASNGFYVEYTGPVQDVGIGDTVLKSDESPHRVQGETVYLEGTVPEDAPIGLYILTYFEQRYSEGSQLLREAIAREDIPKVADLIVGEPPKSTSIPWAKIKRVG